MSTTPVRPVTNPKQIDPETERILLARLATFDEDVKTAVDARAAIAEIRKNLKQPAPR